MSNNYIDTKELEKHLLAYQKSKNEESRVWLWEAIHLMATKLAHKIPQDAHLLAREDVISYVVCEIMEKLTDGRMICNAKKGSAFNWMTGSILKQILTRQGQFRAEIKRRKYEHTNQDDEANGSGRLGEPTYEDNPLDALILKEEIEMWEDSIEAMKQKAKAKHRLGHGQFIKLDPEDEHLLAHKWHQINGKYYFNRNLGYLHRVVMKCPEDKYVSFLQGGYKDLRKCNLLITDQASPHQTQQNALKGVTKTCKVGLKHRDIDVVFEITVVHKKKRVIVKSIKFAKHAAMCYDYIVWHLTKQSVWLNYKHINYNNWTPPGDLKEKCDKAIKKLA